MIILIIFGSFSAFLLLSSKNYVYDLIGVYVDNEYKENIPNKNEGYIVEKIVCDNDTSAIWDYKNWAY